MYEQLILEAGAEYLGATDGVVSFRDRESGPC